MATIVPAIWFAGLLQLLVASANFFAPRKLQYRENLAQASQTVRDIFAIHCVYIILILVSFALLCFTFAHELAGGSPLGRSLSGFLACFWGLRIAMQLFHYNREIKRKHPIYNAIFLATFICLTIIFTLAAIG